MQRIGVFVCHCGSNIAATVDVKKVVEVISQEPGVVHAEDYQYMCSEAGQEKIIQAIREKELTGVVAVSYTHLPGVSDRELSGSFCCHAYEKKVQWTFFEFNKCSKNSRCV